MSEWLCESCIYYPPSATDGKPCCVCNTDDPLLDCYQQKDGKDGDRWISVEERLPEKDEYVLVRFRNNDMSVACVFDRWSGYTLWRAQTDEGWCADCDTEPTHWMPLPEPPKEET